MNQLHSLASHSADTRCDWGTYSEAVYWTSSFPLLFEEHNILGLHWVLPHVVVQLEHSFVFVVEPMSANWLVGLPITSNFPSFCILTPEDTFTSPYGSLLLILLLLLFQMSSLTLFKRFLLRYLPFAGFHISMYRSEWVQPCLLFHDRWSRLWAILHNPWHSNKWVWTAPKYRTSS